MSKTEFTKRVRALHSLLNAQQNSTLRDEHTESTVQLFEKFDPVLAQKYRTIESAKVDILNYLNQKLKG